MSNEIAERLCGPLTNYRYLYGAKDQAYTLDLVNKLARMYPNNYGSAIYKLAVEEANKGFMAIDCSGFVCKVLGIKNQGSSTLKSESVQSLPINIANAKEGMAIWRQGHIAYIGPDLKIYEASGTKNDMRVTDFNKRAKDFTYLLVVKGSALADAGIQTPPTSVPEAPTADLTEIAKQVIAGKYGNGSERRKRLEEAGYDYSEVQKKVNELIRKIK